MDMVFMAGISLLWGAMALLVKGFDRLDPSTKGQS